LGHWCVGASLDAPYVLLTLIQQAIDEARQG
jgi:hypothetical protein